MGMTTFDHIITNITDLEEKYAKQTKLDETLKIYKKFSTLERYPIFKLLVLYTYLSDIALDYPLTEKDELFSPKEKSTLNGRIHTQLKVLERILNLPDNVPSTVEGLELVLVNAYGYRSEHCKGRIYGHYNTMTLISRQCRYYLFKDLYFDLDLKNAHPTILMSYARNNSLDTEILETYVNNRENFLQDLMQSDNLTRSEAKTAVLRCLNLTTDFSLTNFLKPLHKEILIIRNHLYKNNISESLTPLGEYTMSRDSFKNKDVERQKVSLQAQYCATEESRSLYILYEVCIQKGLLNRDATLNRKVKNISFIPFFDGAYVSFENLRNLSEVKQILEDTNELIYPYSFEVKEIEPEWEYINEDDLRKYEIIHRFLAILTEKQYNKLLELLDIQPFQLDSAALDDIEGKLKESRSDLEKVAEDDQEYKLRLSEAPEFHELIDKSARLYKSRIRKKLLEYISEGDFEDLQDTLEIDKDMQVNTS